MRISKTAYYLKIAEAVLERSTCLRRRYGAIIVKDDVIVATGYNGSPRGAVNCCDSGECERNRLGVGKGERYELCKAVHAEQNCLINSYRESVKGGTIYIVGKEADGKYADPTPCMLCRRMLKNAGIEQVIGIENDEQTGFGIKKINLNDLDM